MRNAFTLIELLIVIAIVAILAMVVVLVMKPAEILKQARDSQRMSDIASLNTAISSFQVDQSAVSGSQNTLYISLPDTTSTCANLGMPSLPVGWSYHCAGSSTLTKTDGTGWIPENFQGISFGAPLSRLPIDPSNSVANNLFYSFTPSVTGWELNTHLESQKYVSTTNVAGGIFAAGPSQGTIPQFGDNTLIAQWNFEEGSGASVADTSGKGYNGTFSGTGTRWSATALAGSFSGSFSTTTSDVVVVPVMTELKAASAITVIAWVRPSVLVTGGAEYGVVSKTTGSTWKLALKNGAPLFYVYAGGVMDGPSTGAVTNGIWTHLAGVYNGSNVILYKNGVELGRTTKSGTMDNLNFSTTIGAQSSGGINSYTGLIDNVKIYNRALSAAEILSAYNSGQ